MVGRVRRNSKSLKDVRIWQMDWDVRKTIFQDRVNSDTHRHSKLGEREKSGMKKREKRWRDRKLQRQTNRQMEWDRLEHPKETRYAVNKTGVAPHLSPARKCKERLGYNVAHLWSKRCKLELKCGSLQTGCDMNRKRGVEGCLGCW